MRDLYPVLAARVAVATLMALPTTLAAQAVAGTAVEARTGAVVEGAMVVLLDPDGQPRARTLTDDDGHFTLTAPGPGTWQLRVDRIGLASTLSPIFELAAGQTVEKRLELRVEPVRLTELRARGDRRCILRPEQGLEVYRLWNEVRKALEAAAWTDAMGVYRYRLTHFTRSLDPTRPIAWEERQHHDQGLYRQPFESLSAEDLVENGFIRQGDGGLVYSAPDARVLLSDIFLDTHCFRLHGPGRDDDLRGFIGLAFSPVPGPRSRPDVEGVLWVDPTTAELRRLEYSYTRLRSVGLTAGEGKAGGTVDFQRLPNGAWIIREWAVRMPVVEETWARVPEVSAAGVRGSQVVAIREEGARVDEVRDAKGPLHLDDRTWPRIDPDTLGTPVAVPGLGEPIRVETGVGIQGFVRVPGTNKGQLGVAVALLDEDGHVVARTVTDLRGRFRFDAQPPGRYRLRLSHLGGDDVVTDPFTLPPEQEPADSQKPAEDPGAPLWP